MCIKGERVKSLADGGVDRDPREPPLAEAVREALRAAGFQQKAGAAPRGPTVRALQAQLDRRRGQ